MPTITTHGNRSVHKKGIKRLLRYLVVVPAMALVALTVVAAQAQATRYFDPVLMKGKTVLQHGVFAYSTWHLYENGRWNTYYADGPGMDLNVYPRADVVRAGRRLHVRLNKPQRPERFTIKDHETGRHLQTTLRRVERNGKTVAWDAYFRVSRPNHDYRLVTRGVWKPVPGTHIGYGFRVYLFHVKTSG